MLTDARNDIVGAEHDVLNGLIGCALRGILYDLVGAEHEGASDIGLDHKDLVAW